MKKINIFSAGFYVIAVLSFFSCAEPAGTDYDYEKYLIAADTWTVSYNGNGSTGGDVPADSTSHEEGDSVAVLGNTGDFVMTGNVFSGWNTASDGSGTDYSQGDNITITSADVILYATWTLASNTVKVNYTYTGVETSGTIWVVANTTVAVPSGYPPDGGYVTGESDLTSGTQYTSYLQSSADTFYLIVLYDLNDEFPPIGDSGEPFKVYSDATGDPLPVNLSSTQEITIALTDADKIPYPGGVSGTVTFTDGYGGTATNNAGALLIAIAIDAVDYPDPANTDNIMSPLMAAISSGTNADQIALSTAASTVDYEIEGLANSNYWILVIVYNSNPSGPPADTDFGGQYNTSADLTAWTAVTVAQSTVTDIDLTTVPYSFIPDSDAEAVTFDEAALEIGYGGSDSAASVTQDLTLALAGNYGTTVSWSSNNTGVIANDGAVTRPAYGSGDASVTLTATISKGSESDTKDFALTVIEHPYPTGYQVTYTTGAGNPTFDLAYVPGGTFPTGTGTETTAGSGAVDATVDVPFWIAETEVTYELWYLVRDWAENTAGTYTFANKGREGNDGTDDAAPSSDGSENEPVTKINWRDGMVWMNALTEYYNVNNGTDPDLDCVYYTDTTYTTPIRISTNDSVDDPLVSGQEDQPYIKAGFSGNIDMANCTAKGFRLPTSMEWECAARYEDGTNWTAGNYASGAYTYYNDAADTNPANGVVDGKDANDEVAVYSYYWDGSSWQPTGVSQTAEVGTKLPNVLGLYDMSGNVWEWSFDWYASGSTRALRSGLGTSFYPYVLQVGYIENASGSPNTTGMGMADIGLRFSRTP